MIRTGLVVGLLVCAGCLGGTAPSDSGPPDAPWATGDTLNTTALAHQHFAVIRDAGSFTLNRSDRVELEGVSRSNSTFPEHYHPPKRVSHRVDFEADRYLGAHVTVGERRSARFVTPEVTASRRQSCPDCTAELAYDQRPPGDTLSERLQQFKGSTPVTRFARSLKGVTVGFNYTYSGTVEQGGEVLYQYHAEAELSRGTPLFSAPPRGAATVLVTEKGIVRMFRLQYTGPVTVTVDGTERTVTGTHTFTRRYTAIGETTVDRPEWVDRAAEEQLPTTKTGSD